MSGPPQSEIGVDFLAAYAAGDWPRAIDAVEQHWVALIFDRATTRQVFAAVGEAPEDALRLAPRASLVAEVLGRLPAGSVPVRLPGTPDRVNEVLRTGTARVMVEVATLAMIARRATGRPVEAVEIARVSRPLLRAAALTRFSPAADLAAYWHLQAGQAALHLGDLAQAHRDFQHAWTLRADDATGYVAPSAAPFLALVASLCGDHEEAQRWQAEVDVLEPHGRTLTEWDTMERPRLVARLLDASDRLDVDVGTELSDHLLPQLAFDEIWPITMVALVRHLLNTGAVEQAERLIGATVDLHPSAPSSATMHASYVALARADVALAQGHSGEAVRLTPGESRVLAALDGPGGLADVAAGLHVSRNTLKSHLRSLYGKLGVASRGEALARAARLGLLGNGEGPPP